MDLSSALQAALDATAEKDSAFDDALNSLEEDVDVEVQHFLVLRLSYPLAVEHCVGRSGAARRC